MDWKNFIILVSAGINLFLGFFIFSRGKKRLVNVVYSLIALSVSYWSFGMVMYRWAHSVEASILWCRILYTAPIFIVGSFLYFSYIFPETKQKVGKLVKALIFIPCGAIFCVTLFTDKVISWVIFNPGAEKIIVFGSLYYIYFSFVPLFFIWAYVKLLIKGRKVSGLSKVQITYVFLGTFLASTLAMVTNLILPSFNIFYLNWAGQILTLIMVGFIAYAIIIHRLMDIKIALRHSFVYATSLLAIVIPASFVLYYFEKFFPRYIIIASLCIMALGVSVFAPIRDYYYRIANKFFFSSLYDSREVIARLSDGLRSTLDARQIYNLIAETLMNALHIKALGILNYNPKNGRYYVQYNNGFELAGEKEFKGDKALHENFIVKSRAIIVEEIKSGSYKEHKEIMDLLARLGVEVIVPLNIKGETLGIMTVGGKESGDMFNDEDLRTLEVLSSQAAIAIKNAQLYEETKKFSATLQKEVDRQTKELKQANAELQQLDKAKSDFISIASHQLRTPLTAIKGFASLMMEGSYGRLSDLMQDKVQKMYDSSERLIKLVNDMLDLTHMENGKMNYEYGKADLSVMVQSVYDELSVQAQKKNLKFSIEKPPKPVWVWADEQKLRQVVMNITDNSIKYTKEGEVKIALEEKDGLALYSVKDTGMGIKPEDIPHLFQKFVRGTNAAQIDTEGTGVGLYVAKKLIEEMKGEVWAESPGEGKGSAFFIKMAAMKDREAEASLAPPIGAAETK